MMSKPLLTSRQSTLSMKPCWSITLTHCVFWCTMPGGSGGMVFHSLPVDPTHALPSCGGEDEREEVRGRGVRVSKDGGRRIRGSGAAAGGGVDSVAVLWAPEHRFGHSNEDKRTN